MSERSRRRILIVTRNLPPLVGGMERLNWHMARELAKTADVSIIGPSGSAALAPTGITVREALLDPLWKFLLRARSLTWREAKTWKPHVVLAGSGLTAPLALRAARASAARAAVYVHGLDVAVKHPVYRALWLPAIRRMDCVIANSRATAQQCRDIGVEPVRIGIVHPGVGIPGELPSSERISRFRAKHELGNRRLLLSVGRLSTRKGMREFVERALPRIVAAWPDSMLVVVGDPPTQALHAKIQTIQSIQSAADGAGVGHCLKFIGTISDYIELGAVYAACDAHVFPVREISGDPEGFGMVAVEAAAHGLPTVAFATGGVVDAVAEGRSGHLVPPHDYAAFAQRVIELLAQQNPDEIQQSSRAFARGFAWDRFAENAVRLLLPNP